MPVSTDAATAAREALDRWTREVVAWHFDPSTGTPFWFPFVTVEFLFRARSLQMA